MTSCDFRVISAAAQLALGGVGGGERVRQRLDALLMSQLIEC